MPRQRPIEDYLGPLQEFISLKLAEYSHVQKEFRTPSPQAYLRVCTFTREYGGPEEGGWYYNLRTERYAIEFYGTASLRALAHAFYILANESLIEGDPYSVLGGAGISIHVYTAEELKQARADEKETPHYE